MDLAGCDFDALYLSVFFFNADHLSVRATDELHTHLHGLWGALMHTVLTCGVSGTAHLTTNFLQSFSGMGPSGLRIPEALPLVDALGGCKLRDMLHDVFLSLDELDAFCLASVDEILVGLAEAFGGLGVSACGDKPALAQSLAHAWMDAADSTHPSRGRCRRTAAASMPGWPRWLLEG